jgi:hypothetical protein
MICRHRGKFSGPDGYFLRSRHFDAPKAGLSRECQFGLEEGASPVEAKGPRIGGITMGFGLVIAVAVVALLLAYNGVKIVGEYQPWWCFAWVAASARRVRGSST